MRHSTDCKALERHLAVLARCYETGRFEDLFPLLADDCVFETQWRFEPDVGKDAVTAYFTAKGQALRDCDCCPSCDLIRFEGDCNPIRNADILFNGEPHHGTFAMMYEPGKPALLMRQALDGKNNAVVADLTLNDRNQIKRIDLCMPELYRFRLYRQE